MSSEGDQIFQQWESRSCPKCPCKSSTVIDGDEGKYRRCHDCKHVWSWVERDTQSRLVAAVENVQKVWNSYDDCVAVLGITEAENQRELAMQYLRAAVDERGKV